MGHPPKRKAISTVLSLYAKTQSRNIQMPFILVKIRFATVLFFCCCCKNTLLFEYWLLYTHFSAERPTKEVKHIAGSRRSSLNTLPLHSGGFQTLAQLSSNSIVRCNPKSGKFRCIKNGKCNILEAYKYMYNQTQTYVSNYMCIDRYIIVVSCVFMNFCW